VRRLVMLLSVGVAVGVLSVCSLWGASVALADDPGCVGAGVATAALPIPSTMHGTLCLPSDGTASTVMVLVPGATYNHTYWDFPYDPQVYNFRKAMNAAGYATFVVDTLGTGDSSHPLSLLLTATAQAIAVHDVITALRSGQIDGIAFPNVILGGHSLGSAISVIEAGTYHDENAVLLTGIAHVISPTWLVNFFATSGYPAALDPKFAGQGYDPGYLTTRPGTREADFYAPGTTDPNVVAEDEATKDVFAATEAPDAIGVGAMSPYSGLITSPVLLADGQDDQAFCFPTSKCANAAALHTAEAPYYAGSSCFETYVLAGAGHDVNLATDTQDYQQAVERWADAFVGTGPAPVTPPSCSG
jgi:Alpha/beta hydrolase family